MASSAWPDYAAAAPVPQPPHQMQRSGSEGQQKKPQPRQLLSCTKCRERKVKCDRTKPCYACCARGHPKECEFVVGEGNDYSPIQQSYEIRKLRIENQQLKEKLQQARLAGSEEDDNDDGDSLDRKRFVPGVRGPSTKQRRFKTRERIDNLYFGTPGLANIVSDFASLQVGSHSLTHTVPRGRDMYSHRDGPPAYPFPILWTGGNRASDLARELLTSRDLVFECLEVFQRNAQSCYFPHTPDEVTKKEVERFLADMEGNAEKFPDMLALVFAMIATGMQMGVYDKHDKWEPGAVERSRTTSDVYLTACMQALRLGSFMNAPTLLSIQVLIMIGPYLTNSGRFLDAWTLFGTTIRLAQSIGLHRDPKLLDPSPPLREATIRRTIWWWMLHMDQQYSITLGRPLGISGIGDCPPPEPLTTNPTILRLGEFVDHFSILARQILSSDGMMNVAKIDEFTDKLMGLWDTMPEALQFNESWLQPTTSLPEWPLEVMSTTLFAKVQSVLILINRQRVERTQTNASTSEHCAANSVVSPTCSFGRTAHGEHPVHSAPVRGRPIVVNSSVLLLQAFMFFWYRNPAALICWTMGQQAFNASMILILDAWETHNIQNIWMVEHTFAVFRELHINGVHKLAELAVQRISRGLTMLSQRQHDMERQVAGGLLGTMPRRLQTTTTVLQHPPRKNDTVPVSEMNSGDAVMGNTGMFLLEDSGLQSYMPSAFKPLGWNSTGELPDSNASNIDTIYTNGTTIPNDLTPTLPISQIPAGPFPVLASVTHAPALASAPMMMPSKYRSAGSTFTPINNSNPMQLFPHFRDLRYDHAISRAQSPPRNGGDLRGEDQCSDGRMQPGPHAHRRIDRPVLGLRSRQRRK